MSLMIVTDSLARAITFFGGMASGALLVYWSMENYELKYNHLKKLFFEYIFRVRESVNEHEAEQIEEEAREMIEDHLSDQGDVF
jgi:hypothetical protein